MEIWDSKGNAVCHCGKVFIGATAKAATIQMLRARGWHHSAGVTQAGADYEALLCPSCARDEHRKVRAAPAAMDQDDLPLDWEGLRVQAKGSGFASR